MQSAVKMLNEAGSVASIISLFFTAWVIFEVRGLHHFYKRHLLFPKSTQVLSKLSKAARAALNRKQSDEVRSLLQRCDAALERFPKYGDGILQKRVKALREKIAEVLKEPNLIEPRVYEVIDRIEALVQSARDFTGDDRWSTRT